MLTTKPSHCRLFNYVLSQFSQTCDAISKVKLKYTLLKKHPEAETGGIIKVLGKRGEGIQDLKICFDTENKAENQISGRNWPRISFNCSSSKLLIISIDC